MADVTVSYHGTIVLLRPETDEAKAWFNENVHAEQMWGGAIAAEPRYADDILQALENEGFSLTSANDEDDDGAHYQNGED